MFANIKILIFKKYTGQLGCDFSFELNENAL